MTGKAYPPWPDYVPDPGPHERSATLGESWVTVTVFYWKETGNAEADVDLWLMEPNGRDRLIGDRVGVSRADVPRCVEELWQLVPELAAALVL